MRDVTNVDRAPRRPAGAPPRAAGTLSGGVVAAMEAELLALRTTDAELRREQAAIVRERAAIDAERVDWIARLHVSERANKELDSALQAERAARAAAQAAAVHAQAALTQRLEQTQARLARAQRWSPRHHAGGLWHRLRHR